MIILIIFLIISLCPSVHSGDIKLSEHASTLKASWTMAYGDPQHTGLARRIVSKGNPQLVWIFRIKGESFLSPIVGYDGTIYLPSQHYIYALYPNGTLKWEYKVKYNITSSPAVDKNGNLYFGTMFYTATEWGGYVYSLDKNGNLRWRYDAKGWVQSKPVIDSNGIIYFYSSSEYLYAFHSDGSLKWKMKLPGSFSIPDAKNTPAISVNGTIYFPASNVILVVNPEGKIIKNISFSKNSKISEYLDYVPTIGSNTLYIGIRACGMGLYAFDLNGNLKWTYREYFVREAATIGPDGTIYATTSNGTLLAINQNGELKWKFGGNGYIVFNKAGVTRNGMIYIVVKATQGEKNYIYALNSDGVLKWKYEIEGMGNSPVIGNDGYLYVSTQNGSLYAFQIGKAIEVEPSPPGLRIVLKNNTAMLNILPPFDNGGLNITSYRIYRSEDGKEFVKIAETKNTTYVDTVEKGGKYKYYVTAVNSIGESEKSNIVEISFENEYLGDKNSVYYVIFGVSSILIILILYYSSKRWRKCGK